MPSRRHFSAIAHINAGKTTFSEAALYLSGQIPHPGNVEDGTTELDSLNQERKRGISIRSASCGFHYGETDYQMIDTPGHVDFGSEVYKGLIAADNTVLLVDSTRGFEAQTESVYRESSRFRLPTFVFLNKLDRPQGRDFLDILAEFADHLEIATAPANLPFYDPQEGHLAGVIDLIGEFLSVPVFEDPPREAHYKIPPSESERIGEYQAYLRTQLAEAVLNAGADAASTVPEDWLERVESEPLSSLTDIIQALIQGRWFLPIFCGSAQDFVGVGPLLSALEQYGADPEGGVDRILELAAAEDATESKKKADLKSLIVDLGTPDRICGLSFGVEHRAEAGRLTLVRLMQGSLEPGRKLFNRSTHTEETVDSIYRLQGRETVEIQRAQAGDIVAASGLKTATAGQTLVDAGWKFDAPDLFPQRQFHPVVSIALETESSADLERLGRALQVIADEDPSLQCEFEESSGRFRASGVGELQLEVVTARLFEEFGLRLNASAPAVVYREVISRSASGASVFTEHKAGDDAHILIGLSITPAEDQEKGFQLRTGAPHPDKWPGLLGSRADAAPEQLLSAKAAGLEDLSAEQRGVMRSAFEESLEKGHLGYAGIENVIIDEVGLKTHGAFTNYGLKTASYMAVQAALENAAISVEEPYLIVDLEIPSELSRMVVADLNRRRAEILSVFSEGSRTKISATAALRALFGFTKVFRSSTRGRGAAVMRLGGYRKWEPAQPE